MLYHFPVTVHKNPGSYGSRLCVVTSVATSRNYGITEISRPAAIDERRKKYCINIQQKKIFALRVERSCAFRVLSSGSKTYRTYVFTLRYYRLELMKVRLAPPLYSRPAYE